MAIIVTGSIAFDSIRTPFGEVKEKLGGSATYFSVAASHFCDVKPVSVVGEDFPQEHLKTFESAGIDTSHITVKEGKTFRWKGYYDYDMNVANTLETHLNVFQDFNPDLKGIQEQPQIVFLANIDPDLQKTILNHFKDTTMLTACDTMDFWIQSKREKVLEVMSECDIVFINEAEVRQLTGEVNLLRAYRYLQKYGVDRLIIKRGEYGAISLFQDSVFFVPAFPLDTVKDPTGAGDSFAGGMLGYLHNFIDGSEIDNEEYKRAVVMGSVIASFTVEDFGIDRLISVKRGEVINRFNIFKKMTDFEPISEGFLST